MNKETLSDKIKQMDVNDERYGRGYCKGLEVEDVKEFIRLLKERLCICTEDMECSHCQVIDKLAGDKLVGEDG